MRLAPATLTLLLFASAAARAEDESAPKNERPKVIRVEASRTERGQAAVSLQFLATGAAHYSTIGQAMHFGLHPNGVERGVRFAFGLPAAPDLSDLDYGPRRTFVLKVPPGGVDLLYSFARGVPAEEIFPAGTTAMQRLRETYQAERDKLEQEWTAAQARLAERAVELRRRYEKRANDVLTGSDRAQKEALDAVREKLAADLAARLAKLEPRIRELEARAAQGWALAKQSSEPQNLPPELAAFAKDAQQFMQDAAAAARELVDAARASLLAALDGPAREKLKARLESKFPHHLRPNAKEPSAEAEPGADF
ncbi:MAG: hypothetical protein AMXMBFR7_10660 [Planctomycetota bacterium]